MGIHLEQADKTSCVRLEGPIDISLAEELKKVLIDALKAGEEIHLIPAGIKRKYFLRSRTADSHRVRVVPELRRLIEFRRLNFMDADYCVAERPDAILCRNVIIYFDRATQESILAKLSACLVPGGYLFVGHAETLHNTNLPLTPVAPSLYRRVDDVR